MIRNLTVRLDTLQSHSANYNKHSDDQIRRLAKSLSAFGQVRSIVCWRNTILAGHGVVSAARSLGWSELRADVLDEAWSEDRALAYLVADNELARRSDPDQAQLAAILEELQAREPVLVEAAGYMNGELEALLRLVNPKQPVDAEPQIDRAEELRQKWNVQSGQLWACGEHRLICGDCTDAAVVGKVMGEEKAALMVTDPPYGVEYDPAWRDKIEYSANRRIGKVENDGRVDWLEAWALFGGNVAYVWHASLNGAEVQISLEQAGFAICSVIIWNKKGAYAIGRGNYHWQHEPMFYAVRHGKSSGWAGDRTQTTIWDVIPVGDPYGRNGEPKTGHGTQKPLECMLRPIQNHDACIVYDPFLGSGTTLIACENLGRRCRAIEISPAYVAVCLERFYSATNKQPHLLEAALEGV